MASAGCIRPTSRPSACHCCAVQVALCARSLQHFAWQVGQAPSDGYGSYILCCGGCCWLVPRSRCSERRPPALDSCSASSSMSPSTVGAHCNYGAAFLRIRTRRTGVPKRLCVKPRISVMDPRAGRDPEQGRVGLDHCPCLRYLATVVHHTYRGSRP